MHMAMRQQRQGALWSGSGLDIVKGIWEKLDHAGISKTGYKQTGPDLPLEGPILKTDIGDDLLPVYEALCPHPDPLEVGTEIREEARKVVNRYWGDKVHTWQDYSYVIEAHLDHPSVEEGEEGARRQIGPESGRVGGC